MRLNQKTRPSFNRLPLVVALLSCLAIPMAAAQQDDADEEEDKKDSPASMERITVTGSLLRRLEYDTASPVQVISADVSMDMGQFDVADMLQSSSVAAGSTQINHQFSGFVVEGGTGVQTLSLRGLGAQRTLVLLDDRRPGPAGTRGQVAAFDLNVIPTSILQRAEILKDGSSSIYGSDAVGGVVNLITRKRVDRPTLSFDFRVPLESGGEIYSISGATGFSFDRGDMVLAAEFWEHRPLHIGDRDYFRCAQDLMRDQAGNRIDRVDRSTLVGTGLEGCNSTNLYANTVIDAITGVRYIPSPDGVTIGLIPGYRPRTNANYTASNPQAFYEDWLNFDFFGDTQVIDNQKRMSLYGATDFNFDSFNWYTKFLYNERTTDARRFRQFFPVTGGSTAPANFRYANSPNYVTPVPSGVAQPIMPFRSNQEINVDYFYAATGIEGMLSTKRDWSWRVDASYSYSDGKYNSLGIVASRSGDVRFDSTAPRLDYFDPCFLSGACMDQLEAAIGEWNRGKTIYDQFVVSGVLAGEAFDLPAGPFGVALGVEFRDFSIDDQPSALSRNGDLWGQSSAQVTKGSDHVTEIFGEIEVPLLSGVTGFESLTFSASGRVFDYKSVSGTDNVWKMGLNWQIIPTLRARASLGTSYRAPGLYELYLGNQTAFVGQLAIDPCIRWEDSTNDFIRANCAAAGIPGDFPGGTSSATVVTGGGFGVVKPETSRAFTSGLIFTPTFANISMAIDYFKFEVKDEISQLGSGAILGGCYAAPVFPNNFCNLFDRNPANHPTNPFMITTVRDSYINVNRQKVRGYDLLFRYDGDFNFGKLELEGQATYMVEDFQQLFSSAVASGFNTNQRGGAISRPKLVGNTRAALRRGDWTYSWFMDYVHPTKNLFLSENFTYLGFQNAVRDIRAERRFYQGVAVRYGADNWDALIGVRNLFDKDPPNVSAGAATRYGNVPAFATQYDWYGRTVYARFAYRF